MKEVSIDFDFSQIKELSKAFAQGLTEAALPNTAQAFQESSRMIYNAWQVFLAGETSLDGINPPEKVSRSAISSIKQRKLRDFDYSVYSESQEMDAIIKGKKDVDYDMKKTHPYGLKSRVSKKGIPYLIIPFRWGTPNGKSTKRAHFSNFIPQKVYETNVKGMKLSRTTGLTHIEGNYKGQAIDRAEYVWGSRLKDAWDDRAEGMVRMKDVKGSTYFTFRIISAKSPAGSWLYHRDGEPGIDIIGALQRTFEPAIRKNIDDAIKDDISDFQ